ncbi:unnamed protein product [Diamesa hyperborea]
MSYTAAKYHHTEDEEFGSDRSTLRYGLALNSNNSVYSDNTLRANSNIKCINSATYIQHEIYKSDDFESDSEELLTDDNGFIENVKPTSVKQFKIGRILEQDDDKRRESYKKWLSAVTNKEKEKRKLQQQARKEEENAKKLAENERKYKSQEIVTRWMQEKKEKEVQRKSRAEESRKVPDSPPRRPPTIKKNVAFDQWLQKKNQEEKAKKMKMEEKQKLNETYQKCRNTLSGLSYDKWSRNAQSKPKHVPLNQGLDTLRGSISKIYINPIPWKNLDD